MEVGREEFDVDRGTTSRLTAALLNGGLMGADPLADGVDFIC